MLTTANGRRLFDFVTFPLSDFAPDFCMILNQLTLRNSCLYGGTQVLDLAPTQRRGLPEPIVLFGGINGGGKTTLLDAVQLVLYGN